MSKRSLKLSSEGIKQARTAIKHKGWTQKELAGFLGWSTQPIYKFFNEKTVARYIFRHICKTLNLNIQEVVDNSGNAKTDLDVKTPNTSIDINALVQEVRQNVRDSIVRQCGTIRVLDMAQPIGLNDIYTNVNILETITGRRSKKNCWISTREFQVYFTAKAIVNRCNHYAWDDPALHGLVRHIFDKRWREVFLLVAEMLPSADCLLLLMKQQFDLLVASDEKLQQFLGWVDQKSVFVKDIFFPAAVMAF